MPSLLSSLYSPSTSKEGSVDKIASSSSSSIDSSEVCCSISLISSDSAFAFKSEDTVNESLLTSKSNPVIF